MSPVAGGPSGTRTLPRPEATRPRGIAHQIARLVPLPAAVLTGLAFAAPIVAYAARQEDPGDGFNVLFRFIIMPMFLFSGTFFPIDQLHPVLQSLAWATPLWHGVELARGFTLGTATLTGAVGHTVYLAVWLAAGLWLAERIMTRKLAS